MSSDVFVIVNILDTITSFFSAFIPTIILSCPFSPSTLNIVYTLQKKKKKNYCNFVA